QEAAPDDSTAFELLEPLGEHVRRDPREARAQVGEALRPEDEVADDEQRPAFPDEIERAGDPAVLSVAPDRFHFVNTSFQLLWKSIVMIESARSKRERRRE